MHFVISCQDKADGGLELRKANRDAHIAYLQNHKSQLVAAGPTLSDDGET
ncbi:MAG: YciI family protein, partial [Rhodospirillaceae bacterium]|nr:YciI family protein [Rhodospirillaceae bacterium]